MCDVFIKFCESGDYSGACSAAAEIVCTGKRGIDFFLGFVLDTFSCHGRYRTWVREMMACIEALGEIPRQNMIYNPVFKVNTCTIIFIMILVLKKERHDNVSATQCPPSARVVLASEAEAILYDKNMIRIPDILSSSSLIRGKVDTTTFNTLSAIVNTLRSGKRTIAMFLLHTLVSSKAPVMDAEWPDDIKEIHRNDIVWILWKIALDSGYGMEEYKLYRHNFSSKARKKRIGLLFYVYAYHFGMKDSRQKRGRLDEKERSKVNEAAKLMGDIIDELIPDEVGEEEGDEERDADEGKDSRIEEKEPPRKREKRKRKKSKKQKQPAKPKSKSKPIVEHEPIPIHMLAITHIKEETQRNLL